MAAVRGGVNLEMAPRSGGGLGSGPDGPGSPASAGRRCGNLRPSADSGSQLGRERPKKWRRRRSLEELRGGSEEEEGWEHEEDPEPQQLLLHCWREQLEMIEAPRSWFSFIVTSLQPPGHQRLKVLKINEQSP